MKNLIKGVIYGLFGAGLFIVTSIAFSPSQINEYWLILPASLGFIAGFLESLREDNLTQWEN